MLIITAPAKTQNFKTPWLSEKNSQPPFLSKSEKIAEILRTYSSKKLAKLYHSSPKIAEENCIMLQNWQEE